MSVGGSSKTIVQGNDPNSNIYIVGSFRIDLNEVTMVGLKSMRKLLPKAQYANLKVRKGARDSRKK